MKILTMYDLIIQEDGPKPKIKIGPVKNGGFVKFSDYKEAVEQSDNTTKDKIIQILLKMSEDDRLDIIHCGKWCSLCGSTNLPCYCAPCYDE